MEGSKGGSTGTGKWFTGYRSVAKRWQDYVRMRREKALPVVGSQHLFAKLWKEHKVSACHAPSSQILCCTHADDAVSLFRCVGD